MASPINMCLEIDWKEHKNPPSSTPAIKTTWFDFTAKNWCLEFSQKFHGLFLFAFFLFWLPCEILDSLILYIIFRILVVCALITRLFKASCVLFTLVAHYGVLDETDRVLIYHKIVGRRCQFIVGDCGNENTYVIKGLLESLCRSWMSPICVDQLVLYGLETFIEIVAFYTFVFLQTCTKISAQNWLGNTEMDCRVESAICNYDASPGGAGNIPLCLIVIPFGVIRSTKYFTRC